MTPFALKYSLTPSVVAKTTNAITAATNAALADTINATTLRAMLGFYPRRNACQPHVTL